MNAIMVLKKDAAFFAEELVSQMLTIAELVVNKKRTEKDVLK
jgi:hypothetical protein